MTMKDGASYGHAFQLKVLYSLLNDRHFIQNMFDIISPDYFDNAAHKWVIDFSLKYFAKYHTYPTAEVLSIETKKEKNEVLRISIRDQLKQVYNSSDDDMDYVQEEFFTFCKNQRVKEAILKCADLLVANDFDSINRIINNAMKAGVDKNIGHEYSKDVETRYREEDRNPIPYPWEIFNNVSDGGYGKGELIIFFAPPGVGKSWVVCNMGAHAAKLGKNVLHYTLELSESYVGKRYDAILTGIDVKELKKHRSKVEKSLQDLPGRIIIKEYPPKRATLDTLMAHMRQLQYIHGFVPDLIIIDYPDLLGATKVRNEIREETDDIYTELKGLAKELFIPIICPSQINRMGAKDDIIEGDKIAGSFGKLMIADGGISLSRKREDKIRGTGRFHWIKNRNGPDGMTYEATINMNNGKIVISDTEYTEEENVTDTEEYKHKLKNKFLKLDEV